MTAPRAASAGPPGPVRILFLDVDGTLTDGVITESAAGDLRNFWVRDGLALLWARDLGLLPVVISGRPSQAVEGRMKDLGLECHPNPAKARSDAATQLPLDQAAAFLDAAARVRAAVGERP